jgi:hypothetical protein
MKNTVSLSPRGVFRSRRSRVLIILARQRVWVESSLPDLGSSANPVVPELGGNGMRKPPRSGRRRPRRDSHMPLSEIIAAPPVATRLLA